MARLGPLGRKRIAPRLSLFAREQTADSGDRQLVRFRRTGVQRRRKTSPSRFRARFQTNFWRGGIRQRLSRHGAGVFGDALKRNRESARPKERRSRQGRAETRERKSQRSGGEKTGSEILGHTR